MLAAGDVRLPSGDRLTPRRFQTLGLHLGVSDGFETIHHLIEQAFVPGTDEFSFSFLRGFEQALVHETSPIFSLLHEACYTRGFASDWSAQRVRAAFPAFDPAAEPFLFTGEMIYPWMFEEIGALAPLREAAGLLARRADWPELYDQGVLAATRCRARRPSTTRTCTSTSSSRAAPRPRSGACASGRPTSTCTTGCARRARACSARLLELVDARPASAGRV